MNISLLLKALVIAVLVLPSAARALDVPITVKEVAGVGTAATADPDGTFPVTAVIPLPRGSFTDPSVFRLEDSFGNPVPAQFSALNRWWMDSDQSIRHLTVEFQPSVAAFTGSGTGQSVYHLTTGAQASPQTPVTVSQDASFFTVITGPLKFTVRKNGSGFAIIETLWHDKDGDGFQNSDIVISPDQTNGGMLVDRFGNIQRDSSRTDVTVTLEEAGPMRAVIKAEAPARDYAVWNQSFTHGWAVRIYAYAGKPYIKVDYQLQNSAKTTPLQGKMTNKPEYYLLYFTEMNMNFGLSLTAPTVKFGMVDSTVYNHGPVGGGVYLAQESHDISTVRDLQTDSSLASATATESQLRSNAITGWLDASDSQRGVTAIGRYFWEMWPNGLAINSSSTLSVQLFPSWGKMWNPLTGTLHSSSLKWLWDMQHVYKETYLFFHDPSVTNTQINNLAKTMEYHPVAVAPYSQYQQAQASFDLDGLLPPIQGSLPKSDVRLPGYSGSAFQKNKNYIFHWNNFRDDDYVRSKPSQEGGWVYGASHLIATGDPQYYWLWEQRIRSDLNLRPQWLEGFQFATDFAFQQLTENPYGGRIWRAFPGNYPYDGLEAPVLAGTDNDNTADWGARDVMHMWTYYVRDTYTITGNPWIRDWYTFIKEFEWTRLEYTDPWPTMNARAKAHSLGQVIQAYQVTGGSTSFGSLYGDYFQGQPGFQKHFYTNLFPEQNSQYGNPGNPGKDRAEFVGYLMRTIIDYMRDNENNPQAWAEGFNYISGLIEWNYNWGQYCYNCQLTGGDGPTKSGVTIMADPISWYYWNTGLQKYLTDLDNAMAVKPPYTVDVNSNNWYEFNLPNPWDLNNDWSGQYHARMYQYVKKTARPDTTPPAAITDLTAQQAGGNIILRWTAPPDQDLRKYHIVWSTKPITAQTTTQTSTTNWWAANAVGPGIVPTPGAVETYTVTGVGLPFYAAIFTFDQNGNLGSMSNVAQASPTGNNAQFISQQVPAGVKAGQQFPVSITMKNTGTTTWTRAAGYYLGGQGMANNTLWSGWNSLSSSDSIAPGQSKIFSFTATAPWAAGTYGFQYRMIDQGNSEWFGDFTDNVPVTVTSDTIPPGPPGDPVPAIASETQINLTWAAAVDNPGGSGVAGYRVDAAVDANFTVFVPGWNDSDVGNVLGAPVAGLTPLTSYFFRVRAYDAAGNTGPDSATATATTPAPPVDNPPVVVLNSPPNRNITKTGVIVFNATATDDYQLLAAVLYTNLSGAFSAETTTIASLTGTRARISFNLTLAHDTDMIWNILVCDIAYQCAFSPTNFTLSIRSGTITTGDNPPTVTLLSPPDMATVTANVTFTVILSDDTGIVNATLYHNISGVFAANTTLTVSGGTAAALSFFAVLPNTTVLWNVRACDTAGQCSFAAANFSFTVADACPDTDSDGFSPSAYCSPVPDCDDSNPAAYPGAPEVCGNGVDEDCSGADAVCSSSGSSSGGGAGGGSVSASSGNMPLPVCRSGSVVGCSTGLFGVCGHGVQTCSGGSWGQCVAATASTEICDGLDNDCNGQVDDDVCECTDGDIRPCGSDVGSCSEGVSTCSVGSWGPCAGSIAPAEEVCDGVDNDCDTQTDEGCQLPCANGVQDAGEDGVDCGGACQACRPPSLVTATIAAGAVLLVMSLLLKFLVL